jgi:hypothetical protein
MLVSCASKGQMRQKALDTAFDDGDFIGMANNIQKNGAKLYGENSLFLYHMDLGVLYHYAGQHEQSNQHLQQAAQIHHDLFTRSVTNEAAALLTNDNVRPYRSKPYELTFLHQIAALNFMAMGDFNGALVESRKAQILFNEWERTRASEGKFHTDGMFHLMTSLAYENIDEPDNSLISLFKSVDAYNKGPVRLPEEVAGFAYDRLKAGDREDDITRLGIAPNTADNSWDAKMGASEIIIVGYAGRGPAMLENNWHGTYDPNGRLFLRGQTRAGRLTIDIPAPPLPPSPDGRARGVDRVLDVKMSFPELVDYNSTTDHFSAWLDDSDDVAMSVIVNDYDLLSKKELEDSWGDIVLRTAVRTVIRTLAANETKNRINTGNPLANALLSVGTDVATDQMEKADIRMCFLLPQRMHIIRIPVEPGTHNVNLAVHGRNGRTMDQKIFNNVEVKRGEKKVLLHHSLR